MQRKLEEKTEYKHVPSWGDVFKDYEAQYYK